MRCFANLFPGEGTPSKFHFDGTEGGPDSAPAPIFALDWTPAFAGELGEDGCYVKRLILGAPDDKKIEFRTVRERAAA